MQSLKQIEEQQKELQAAIQTAKAEKEEMLERDRDFYDPKAKDLPPPKMEVRMMPVCTSRIVHSCICHLLAIATRFAGAERQQYNTDG